MKSKIVVFSVLLLVGCLPNILPHGTGIYPVSFNELIDTTVVRNGFCNIRIYNNSSEDVYIEYLYDKFTSTVKNKVSRSVIVDERLTTGTYINVPLQCSEDTFKLKVYSNIDKDVWNVKLMESKLDSTRIKLFLVREDKMRLLPKH